MHRRTARLLRPTPQESNKTVTNCNVALVQILRAESCAAAPTLRSSRSHAHGFVLPQPAGLRAARGPRAPEHKGDPQPLSSAAALSITSTSKAVACAVISTAGNVTTRPTAQTTTSARAMVWGPAGHAERRLVPSSSPQPAARTRRLGGRGRRLPGRPRPRRSGAAPCPRPGSGGSAAPARPTALHPGSPRRHPRRSPSARRYGTGMRPGSRSRSTASGRTIEIP